MQYGSPKSPELTYLYILNTNQNPNVNSYVHKDAFRNNFYEIQILQKFQGNNAEKFLFYISLQIISKYRKLVNIFKRYIGAAKLHIHMHAKQYVSNELISF
jgi:hypothetical protein